MNVSLDKAERIVRIRKKYLIFFLMVVFMICIVQCYAAARYTLVTILHTNDLHGRVMSDDDGTGGLARISTLIRQIRSDMPYMLLLDAGDIIHGTIEEYLYGGLPIISAMNAIGYQAAVTGNHEYDFGLPTLRRACSTAHFPFLAANVQSKTGGQWDKVSPYTIFDYDGIKVAVLGLTTLQTVSLHWPNSIKDISVENPFEVAKKLVPRLRDQADVIVILSHLGIDEDEMLAANVSGIDFIIGGHSHTMLDHWHWVGNTLITQAGSMGRVLGRIDFIVRKDDSSSRIESVNGKYGSWNHLRQRPLGKEYPGQPLIVVDKNTPQDTAVVQAYLPYKSETDRQLSTVIAYAESPISGTLNKENNTPQESLAGNLVADAVRSFANSDVAMIDLNSVSVDGLPAGQITVRSAFDMIKGFTRQEIVVTAMTGADIKSALLSRLSKFPVFNLSLSGIVLEYSTHDGALQIDRLTIADQSFDPLCSYTVAAQAYVMMDLMTAAPEARVIAEPRGTTREALVDYFKSRKVLQTPGINRIVRN
jgi:2',3'-cyclic-nucleotide 2'-phosphodiesterase (5'-nucleotidase family)